GRRHEPDERAHPREPLPRQLRERPDDAPPPALPERVLGDDERDAPDEQEEEPDDQEAARAVVPAALRGDAREPPDVAGPDGDAEHAEEEAEAGGEALLGGVGHRGMA